MEIQRLHQQLTSELLDQEHVSGVGIGTDDDGNEVVVVNVERGHADSLTLPQGVDGSNVDVRETGPFHAEVVQNEPQAIDRKGRHRPVPGGVSAGHKDITAGTTGFIVEDTDGNQYATSNNHVYANVNQGSAGDAIVQPGPTDGGTVANDQSATLEGYVPIEDGAVLDFAWASQVADHLVDIGDLGTPQGSPVDVAVGDVLTKAGRTTGITDGTVDQVSVNVNVGYGNDNTYQINDCIITGDMSDGGDSGSAVLMKDTMEPAGVLFAGSDSATVLNPATHVQSETGLSIVTGGESTPSVSVTLTLQQEDTGPETGNITAQVEDKSGNAVGSATVTISGAASDSATAGSTGMVTFSGVPIGDYTIEADKDGFVSDSTSVSSDQFS